MNNTTRARTGFTLIELIAVIVVLAILAGVALPRYFDYQDEAKSAACKGALGGIRAGIANYYADQAIQGSPAYPTLAQLAALGTVMQEAIPPNPYDDDNTINAQATEADADARTITGGGGWAYYIDNTATPKKYIFYANTDTASENDF